ncbi:MAG: glycosyltransferase family 2 protein [Actinomycetota bacterium]
MKHDEYVDVSVVLPVFNEREHLEEELTRLRAVLDAAPFTWEVVAVDDGSTDGSDRVLAECDWIRLVTFRRNQGVGTARRIGSLVSRGRAIVWTDADLSYPNDEIPRLVKLLEDADQVIGARRKERGTMRVLRWSAKRVARGLAGYLVNQKIPDLNSGLRAFRREALLPYLPLLPKGFSCVSTATLAFIADGRPVRFEAVDYHPRAGLSKFHPIHDAYLFLLQIIGISMYHNPLRAFVPLAVTMFTLAFAKLGFDFAVHPWRVATNTILIFSAAFQVAVLGLVADLVVRTRSWPRAVGPTLPVVREPTAPPNQ